MITKERLEELIEQGATIWTVNKSGNINPVKTNKTCEIQRQYLMKEGQIYSYIEQTFETKEEAEWYREFGYIERTERLELPTWEEFIESDNWFIKFISKKGNRCMIQRYYDNEINSGFLYVMANGENLLEKCCCTKENYYEACKLAKELFLGEKK